MSKMGTAPSETARAYMAGFFDGEGCVSITINNKRLISQGRSATHVIQVSIGNTVPDVLYWMKSFYGGSIAVQDFGHGRKRVYRWNIRCNKALPFLEHILPYLKMKSPQVKLAITHQKEKKFSGPSKLALKVIEERERRRKEMSKYNMRGICQ